MMVKNKDIDLFEVWLTFDILFAGFNPFPTFDLTYMYVKMYGAG